MSVENCQIKEWTDFLLRKSKLIKLWFIETRPKRLTCAEKHLFKIRNKSSRLINCMLLCMFSESTIWPSILMNSFFNAQFNYCPLIRMLHSRNYFPLIRMLHSRNYCPLIRMLHSRRNNNIIKNLHERCLRLIYNDKNLSYERFLTKYDSVSIHHRNIHAFGNWIVWN